MTVKQFLRTAGLQNADQEEVMDYVLAHGLLSEFKSLTETESPQEITDPIKARMAENEELIKMGFVHERFRLSPEEARKQVYQERPNSIEIPLIVKGGSEPSYHS